jgi:putative transposase
MTGARVRSAKEVSEHLGHEKDGTAALDSGNIRNGTRPKTVLTDTAGEVTIEVPGDRAGTFVPVIVKKRQRQRAGSRTVKAGPVARKGTRTGAPS